MRRSVFLVFVLTLVFSCWSLSRSGLFQAGSGVLFAEMSEEEYRKYKKDKKKEEEEAKRLEEEKKKSESVEKKDEDADEDGDESSGKDDSDEGSGDPDKKGKDEGIKSDSGDSADKSRESVSAPPDPPSSSGGKTIYTCPKCGLMTDSSGDCPKCKVPLGKL